MIETLGDVTLKTGDRLTVRLMQPPEPEYGQLLCRFLRHKSDSDFRAIRQRLEGRYVEHCVDRYFTGEIRGRLAAQVWYGYGRGGAGIGNFGHTYTVPEFRRRGIMKELLRFLLEDFANSDAIALLCTGEAPASAYYQKIGFEFVADGPRAGHDPMALIKKDHAADFRELDERYFAAGSEVIVRPGTIRERHDCDRMMDFSPSLGRIKQRWGRTFAAACVPTYIEALYRAEDGRGLLTVCETASRSIVGYGFAVNIGSPLDRRISVFDFLVHPNYFAEIDRLVSETASLAGRMSFSEMVSFVPECAQEKLAGLLRCGFSERYRFRNAYQVSGGTHDVIMLSLAVDG